MLSTSNASRLFRPRGAKGHTSGERLRSKDILQDRTWDLRHASYMLPPFDLAPISKCVLFFVEDSTAER